MNKHEQITPKMQEAAVLLAAGSGPSDVAKKLKISRTQLYKWRKNPKFKRLVYEETTARLEGARTLLMSCAEDAVNELASLMTTSPSDSVRLRAAQTIIAETGLGALGSGNLAEGETLEESVDGLMEQLGWV